MICADVNLVFVLRPPGSAPASRKGECVMKVIRDWSVMDVLDLRKGIAQKQTLMEMAASLHRNPDDVWEKATALNLWGKKIEFRRPQKQNPASGASDEA
jgi:hypothetical protein